MEQRMTWRQKRKAAATQAIRETFDRKPCIRRTLATVCRTTGLRVGRVVPILDDMVTNGYLADEWDEPDGKAYRWRWYYRTGKPWDDTP